MDLATVAIQTASGSSSPEMKLDGILQASELRDFLYSKMRGAREEESEDAGGEGEGGGESAAGPGQEALGLLHEIRDAVARLAEPAPGGGSGSGGGKQGA